MAKLVRAISDMGGVVISVIDSTDIVKRMEEIHETSAVVSAALGRLLTASQLMASNLKSVDDSITLRIKADGPIGLLTVGCDGRGNCKGYVENNIVELALRPDGKLDVGSAVGRDGYLYVVKDIGLKEPYVGSIPLESGEIAEDITAYYATSAQTPSVCSLGVLVEPESKDIIVSGGFIIQLLPTAMDDTIDKVERCIKNIDPVTKMMVDGKTPEEICRSVLKEFELDVLDEYNVAYKCNCSRDKVSRALISAGEEALKEMAEYNTTQVSCNFCDKRYEFTSSEIKNLIKK